MSTGIAAIEAMLKRTMGLDPASVGPSSIRHAVQTRLEANGRIDLDTYWQQLCNSPAELEALIEAVVVPGTWFFRERDAFTTMVDWVRQDWLPRDTQGPLRALSLPCATGEEPYSMAMALLDAGLPAHRFAVDAVDISHHALESAGSALYGRNAFRIGDMGFRDRHFERTADGYLLAPRVRQQLRFLQGNIFADDFLPGNQVYDLIFCRNVLIYFDPPMQQQAVAVLARLLDQRGCLVVGASEAGRLQSDLFVSSTVSRSSAFHHAPTTMTTTPPVVDLLAQASRLADQGRLDEGPGAVPATTADQ